MSDFFHVSLEKLTERKSGRVVADNWWFVHPEKGALFVVLGNGSSPQCNRDKKVLEYMKGRMPSYEGHDIVQIPNAYFGNGITKEHATVQDDSQISSKA